MDEVDPRSRSRARLLSTIEQLLEIDATDLSQALNQASERIAEALNAEKIDTFLHDPNSQSLVAFGTSDTPLAKKQKEHGLDRLPIANGGRAVAVFLSGQPYRDGRVDQDAEELPGMRFALGLRSNIGVPIDVAGTRRGVLLASSTKADFFSDEDLRFLEAVARWEGALTHRAELVERMTNAAREEGQRRAAEELLTVLAHDLRNLVTPIQSRIALLRLRAEREQRESEVRDFGALSASVVRLTRLINNLLDAGRLERGLFALRLQPVDLGQLLEETVAALQLPQAPIELRAPEELLIACDPDRLRQAVENVVSNAQKHSPPGREVVVEAERLSNGDSGLAVIRVADSGPGIPPSILAHIFRRYVAGKGSSGLGLGLYIAHGIVAAHGGTLGVRSAPGVGATFEMRIPEAGPGAG